MTDAVKIAVRRRPLTLEEQLNKENILKVDILNENVSSMVILPFFLTCNNGFFFYFSNGI